MTQYTLKLSFDLRQVTQSLAYEFALKDNSNYPMESEGPLAGTFNFTQKDEIYVEVIATAPVGENLKNFAVTDCTFVSVPARMTEYLSLFDQTRACATVEEWGQVQPIPPTLEDEKKNSRRFSISSTKALTVATQNGQWQISGYLSVQLPPLGKVPVLDDARHQLYYFDPESSVGTGGGFGP